MSLPDIALDRETLDRLYPWHLGIDSDLCLIGAGRVISRLLPGIRPGRALAEVFRIDRPIAISSFDDLVAARQQTFILESLDHPDIRLKGEVLPLAGRRQALLLTGPWIRDSTVLDRLGLQVGDFALGDATPDLMFLVDTQAALLESARKLTDQLKTARDQALAMSRAKTEFLANMSHELRTPLNAIIGFSEYLMLFGGRVEPARVHDYARDIHDSGLFLLDIINDLLDLSRIEAGRLTLDEAEFDLAELAEESARWIGPEAAKSGVSIQLAEVQSPMPVRADRRLIRQILVNLLGNAVKFNRRGGSVRVTLGAGSSGLDVEVADTGIGIDPAAIPELFQPFRQVDSKIARRYGGTGLGLAIVRQLARLHGGDVHMTSEPGVGTVVLLQLPGERILPSDPAGLVPEATRGVA